ncbi:hypothetical protein IFM89_030171 [Coptis chinensis]|uniref:glucan endo-1,3-beta-D-glucosidase n=1 Tax=Coptis chinensis TaxID=261450 RepID=A0A835LJW4_9MAGN|nr:hypothetical protein IFM89_030171 [Coptis chinensis]
MLGYPSHHTHFLFVIPTLLFDNISNYGAFISTGNLGNILLIIVPTVCTQKGSPFGDPSGMAYASLSMAVIIFFIPMPLVLKFTIFFFLRQKYSTPEVIGAIYLWSCIYKIVRISSTKKMLEVELNGSINGVPEEPLNISRNSCSDAPIPSNDRLMSGDEVGRFALPYSLDDENVVGFLIVGDEIAAKVDEYTCGMISGSGSSLFEELGLYYIGLVDGHNIDDLVTILKEVKSIHTTGPVFIHVVTNKGRGYPYAERAVDKYHGKLFIAEINKGGWNQESTSEAVNGYYATTLFGFSYGDARVTDIGSTLAAFEIEAIRTWWHVREGEGMYEDEFAKANKVVGMVWANKRDSELWFAPPEWKECRLGIQLLPIVPISEVVFSDRDFARELVEWTMPALGRESVGEGWKGFVYALEGVYDKKRALKKI